MGRRVLPDHNKVGTEDQEGSPCWSCPPGDTCRATDMHSSEGEPESHPLNSTHKSPVRADKCLLLTCRTRYAEEE